MYKILDCNNNNNNNNKKLLNQYIEILNQLENEYFINVNSFISKKFSKTGK